MDAIEAGLYESQMLELIGNPQTIQTRRPEVQGTLARAFGNECGKGSALGQLRLVEGTVERSLYRALQELRRLQAWLAVADGR